MRDFLIDMVLAFFAGLNAAAYADRHHALNLGIAVTCGIAALVPRPKP